MLSHSVLSVCLVLFTRLSNTNFYIFSKVFLMEVQTAARDSTTLMGVNNELSKYKYLSL